MIDRMKSVLDSDVFGRFITAVILVNAVTLGMETSDAVMARIGELVLLIDKLCLVIFILEIGAKLIVWRLRFFRNGWNVFDFLIVGIALALQRHRGSRSCGHFVS